MKKVIRIGDPTDHGGSVTSATSTTVFFGKNVSVVGDSVSCPKQGHVNCVIVEGDPSWSIGGKAVALDGHKVSCGATLISTLGQVSRDYVASVSDIVMPAMPVMPVLADDEVIEHWYTLEDENGKPVEGYCYDLYSGDERITHKGSFDSGKTDAVQGGDSEFVMWLARDAAKRDVVS